MRIKNTISLADWEQTPSTIQHAIRLWKKQYYPHESELLELYQCIELLTHISQNLHTDDSDNRFFNKMLTNIDSVIGWDEDGEGSGLIDTLYYEVKTAFTHLLRSRGKE